METFPNKKQRQASLKGKKKGSKALARLRSLKGELESNEDTDTTQTSGGTNDRGFKDVRTLTEKMRILTWVDTQL